MSEIQGLEKIKSVAWDKFQKLGLPTSKDEAWKYTDLGRFGALAEIKITESPDANSKSLDTRDFKTESSQYKQFSTVVAFINGVWSEDGSRNKTVPGLALTALSQLVKGDRANTLAFETFESEISDKNFGALNLAKVSDGAVIEVTGELTEPVVILQYSTHKSASTHLRNIISLGKNAKADFLFICKGQDGAYGTNTVTQIELEDGAKARVYRIQDESVQSLDIYNLSVRQKVNSHFESHLLSVGGGLSRDGLDVVFEGEGAVSILNGLFSISGSQHSDHKIFVDHATPNCKSEQTYKGIMDENSRGVFSGAIWVREGARLTDAKQTNKNLLLSTAAEIDTKPQLEIYADEVSCSHGATIGQLDEAAVFYMRSRGISEKQARQMLTNAFASEMLDRIEQKEIKKVFETVLNKRGLPSHE